MISATGEIQQVWVGLFRISKQVKQEDLGLTRIRPMLNLNFILGDN